MLRFGGGVDSNVAVCQSFLLGLGLCTTCTINEED